MRIISGSARGKKLGSFAGTGIRPTADRVREALFSILTSRLGSLAGLKVLDAFAGTGALALEALSRGAAGAVLIEQNAQACALIRRNADHCRLSHHLTLLRGSAPTLLARLTDQKPFDLIFLDPPYGRGLLPPALTAVSEQALLAPEGLICVESPRTECLPERIGDLTVVDQRHYGDTTLTFLTLSPRKAPQP